MAGGGEKTEKASPKRKREARERGEVFKSADLISSVTLIALFGTLKANLSGLLTSMKAYMHTSLSTASDQAHGLTIGSLNELYKETLFFVLPLVLPIFLVAMGTGTIINVLQTGPLFVFKKLKPDFKKINPFEGFKRLFSSRTLMELGKSTLKLSLISGLLYKSFVSILEYAPKMVRYNIIDAYKQIMSESINLGITIGGSLLALSIADIIYQWWKFQKDLMMTKQEVKEENKQTEGNPQTKSRIRQAQKKMSARRMMRDMKNATVVITNPTHFAVALRYKRESDRAPVVIAKGQDYLALRIKEKARELKIHIVEDRILARALYQACEIDDEIPPELYQAIAEILVLVYKSM
jgi:flagellar biosynthetic protein FlhB